MKISAIIPCYNGEKFIGQAIQHILNQTHSADEIIIVDDGSTDRSAEIIDDFKEVKCITHPQNLGLPTARNNAMKEAIGEILVYIDVDAYPEPDFIEKILQAYTEENIGAVSGAGYEVRGDTTPNRWRQRFLPQNYGPEPKDNVPFLFGICASFRKSALLDVGGFDPIFRTNGEDVDVSIRLKKKGYRLVYSPFAKVNHHRNDDLKSLLAMIYRWWFWGHKAHLKNYVPYFKEHILITLRMLKHLFKVSIKERQKRFFLLNFLVGIAAFYAIIMARIKD